MLPDLVQGPLVDAADSSGALTAIDIVRLLYPNQAISLRRRLGPSRRHADRGEELYLLPSTVRPRLLVPVGVPEAATMLGRPSTGGHRQLTGTLLVSGIKSRMVELLPLNRLLVEPPSDGPSELHTWLGDLTGSPVRVGILLGRPRPNAKPVLQVFDAAGTTRAFVKVGHRALTRQLVSAETAALERLGSANLGRLAVPRVLDQRRWNGLQFLVLSPLASSRSRQRLGGPPLLEMRELAHAFGTRLAAVRASSYIEKLSASVAALAAPERERISQGLDEVVRTYGDDVIEFGSWHGDWSPWNMGTEAGRTEVWDWERFDDDVPVGFDATHYQAQQLRAAGAEPAAAAASLATEAEAMLGPLGLPPAAWRPVLALYLIEVATRYSRDLRAAATAPLKVRISWTLQILATLLWPDHRKA